MSVTGSPTRHAAGSADWRNEAMKAVDITNEIMGGVALLALPIVVMTPGLIAVLGLCIPLILPLAALGLAFGILSIPFAAVWWLARMARRLRSRRRRDPPPRLEQHNQHPPARPQPETAREVAV
jgi:hypothetical protein